MNQGWVANSIFIVGNTIQYLKFIKYFIEKRRRIYDESVRRIKCTEISVVFVGGNSSFKFSNLYHFYIYLYYKML
jgi:hypothetical protein